MFGILRRQWAKRISVILVPEGGARTISLHFRTVLFVIGAGLALLLFAGTVTLFFSQGRLLIALQENTQLQRKIRLLEVELEKVRALEQQLLLSERTRTQVLTLMGARGEPLDSLGAGEEILALASSSGDDLVLRQLDLLRTVPTAWPTRGLVTRVFTSPGGPGAPYHPGLDIAAPLGSPVQAAGDATVTFAGEDPEYGNLVVLDHGLGFETRYGHNSRLLVRVGERVTRGQPIAAVGSTGNSTAPHLHLEIHKDGVPVDPRRYLD
jgi:murein DD-endopeptidase MepM/ murein hydrolase activator NlpD